MKAWNDLVKTAMLGTQKSAISFEGFPEGIKEDAIKSGIEKEDALLQMASLLSIYKKGGKVFPETQSTLPVAKEELLSPCSQKAGEILGRIISENDTFFLGKWLEECAQHQQLAPYPSLPYLLDKAKAEVKLRSKILSVVGERGIWLSGLNDEWSFINKGFHEIWEDGKPEERKEALRQLRTDNPEEARSFIGISWKGENAGMRLEILRILRINLSIKDESFILASLSDKGKGIKALAQHLLFSIPEGEIMKKIWETVKTWISYKKTKVLLLIGKEELVLSISTAFPDYFADLGIEKESPDKSFSDEEYWLYQVLTIVPPSLWAIEWGIPNEKLINLFLKEERLEKFIPALLNSVIRHQDKESARVIFELKLSSRSKNLISSKDKFIGLMVLLSDAEKISLFNKGIHTREYEFPMFAIEYLVNCSFNWNEEFSRLALKEIKKEVESTTSYEYSYVFSGYSQFVGYSLHSSVLIEKENYKTEDKEKNKLWDKLFDITERKATLLQSFEKNQ